MPSSQSSLQLQQRSVVDETFDRLHGQSYGQIQPTIEGYAETMLHMKFV